MMGMQWVFWGGGCFIILLLVFAWFFGHKIQKKKIQKELQGLEKEILQGNMEQQRLTDIIRHHEDDIQTKDEMLKLAKDKEIKAERITADMNARLEFFRNREKELAPLPALVQKLKIELAEAKSQLETAHEKISYEEKTEKAMSQTFEHLAHKIFEEKNQRFSAQSKTSLTEWLAPFREQMSEFRKQVEAAYSEENKERRSLQNEVRSLKELNRHMTEEANNLARALKGDKKMQGNWGEMVLHRVLEESGLREGHEYHQQVSLTSSEGERQQPDVIVHLPDNKDVIIDAKVSLVDYSCYREASDNMEKQTALKAHVKAIQNHIKDLGEKGYQRLEGIKTLDYILMFIPIESAFYAAVEQQPSLFQEALEKNIMLVSPTNLLVALKTIHHIWSYELQNRNTQKIVDKAGAIYDKLQGLTEDMLNLGTQLNKAASTYDKAMNKFKTGRGNLLKQAGEFVDLKVKVKRKISPALMDEALGEVNNIEASTANDAEKDQQ